MKHFLCLMIVAVLAVPALAQDASSYELRVTADAANHYVAIGETASFSVAMLKDGQPVIGEELTCKLSWDSIVVIEERAVASAAEPTNFSALATHPGFVRLDVSCTPAGGKKLSETAAVAVAPRQIRSPVEMPADFDEFWAAKKALATSEPLDPQMTPVDSQMPDYEIFDLQISCPGSPKPCSGYYGRPKDAAPGSQPAVLFVHSAGVWSSWINAVRKAGRWGAIAYDLNAHGIPNGEGRPFYEALAAGELKGYPFHGIEDRQTAYWLAMFMRIERAIQFLTSQPEWDGRTLIVIGGSQGGGQAVVAAGLDERVTMIVATLPALANQTGFLAGQPAGFPRTVFRGGVPRSPVTEYDRTVADVSRYFDAVNFARRVRAKVVMSVGFEDFSCPPTSVYGMFNAMPSEDKMMLDLPETSHFRGTEATEQQVDQMIVEYLQQRRATQPE